MNHPSLSCLRLLATAAVLLGLVGCGVTDRIGKRMDDSWAADMLSDREQVILTADGGNQLNPDPDGQPLSVVLRVYQLTDLARFASTDADTLWDAPDKALGNTLVNARELILLPGIGTVERWPLEQQAGYVGVAAFFRDDHDAQWKVAFDAESLRKDGIWFSSDGLRILVDHSRIEAMRGKDILNKPPTAAERAAAEQARVPGMGERLQEAALDKAGEAGERSAQKAVDTQLNSYVDGAP